MVLDVAEDGGGRKGGVGGFAGVSEPPCVALLRSTIWRMLGPPQGRPESSDSIPRSSELGMV